MAKEPRNILKFKEMVGNILGHLYGTHPSEQPNDADGFLQMSRLSDDDTDLFYDTVTYLVRSGYLHQDRDHYLQLTPLSWDVLQQPNPLHPDEALGKTLATWTKEAASDIGKSTLTQAAGSALALLFSTVVPSLSG